MCEVLSQVRASLIEFAISEGKGGSLISLLLALLCGESKFLKHDH